jgi:hypothetical protein
MSAVIEISLGPVTMQPLELLIVNNRRKYSQRYVREIWPEEPSEEVVDNLQ